MSAALKMFVSPSAKFHFRTHFVTSLFIHTIHLMEVDEPSRQKPGLWHHFSAFTCFTSLCWCTQIRHDRSCCTG